MFDGKKVATGLICLVMALCAACAIAANKEGLIEYVGAQKDVFKQARLLV